MLEKNLKAWLRIGFIAVFTFLISTVMPGYAKDKTWPEAMSICTKGAGGSSYAVSVGLARIFEKNLGISVAVEPAAGSIAQLELMRAKKAELGICTAVEVYFAIHNKGPWANKGETDVRQVTSGTPLWCPVIVRADSDIRSIKDLAGKKVMDRLTASTIMRLFNDTLYEAYGIKGKVKVIPFSLVSEQVDALKTKRVDAIHYPTVPGTPSVVELAETVGIRFLSIGEKEIEYLCKSLPFLKKAKIPANTFKGQEQDVPLVSFYDDMYCRGDLSDSFVYAITKAMYDNYNEWAKIHRTVKYWSLDTYYEDPVIPFHMGSIKYYKEKGMWGPEQDRIQKDLLKAIGKSK